MQILGLFDRFNSVPCRYSLTCDKDRTFVALEPTREAGRLSLHHCPPRHQCGYCAGIVRPPTASGCERDAGSFAVDGSACWTILRSPLGLSTQVATPPAAIVPRGFDGDLRPPRVS